MYAESAGGINFYPGCLHKCKYCVGTFQRQMKRQRARCQKCYDYVPHAHYERLDQPPPKTSEDEFVFFPPCGDWAFISLDGMIQGRYYMERYPQVRFLCQTKNPRCFSTFDEWPENTILGTTIETDDWTLTRAVSNTPDPEDRVKALIRVKHPSKMVTMEPLMKGNRLVLLSWMRMVAKGTTWFRIYVGFDSHPNQNHLEEPTLQEATDLVYDLRNAGFDVRTKLMRKAWNEDYGRNRGDSRQRRLDAGGASHPSPAKVSGGASAANRTDRDVRL
jgi:hypothetical protein